MKRNWQIVKSIVLYILLTAATIMMCFPLFWMISSSLKTISETNSPGIVWIPAQPSLQAYLDLLQNPTFLRVYFNSVFTTTLAIVGTLISIAAVAYAFSRIEWPGRDIVFFVMLSTMMIPPQALIVPQYVLFNKINWVGTFNPIVIPGYFAGGASMVFLLRQSMSQIPKELDESAFVDGASHFQIWWNIVLPLVRAPLATVSTFLFVGLWNNLLGPLMYLQSVGLYTLPVYTSTLYNINQTVQPWPTIMAAAVLTTVPLIIVFFFAQRYILEGVVVTGMKG
ncbi:MAG TPA: carbohydrate ABC transporter permease [Anaerolineaceae bacterium]|jgi:ABC-type glycerol-3-phosphate transport system permease component|nr:carbohydrate ABC transporter permease [Anaerolineaceae bacterium]HOF24712.1 carbohydrate ABC transporter permease [Anaerolineaceae bacterium]HOR77434.1 carbohydrate ABC transporter permease [Anaerolineaceae bacterium]HPK26149.1 carbohydrate ABC transporter permease [Anaerolineaceae bacterium]HQM65395.1 carbohydrate ABC transporter permease [Anaerolineaceae bacterium]